MCQNLLLEICHYLILVHLKENWKNVKNPGGSHPLKVKCHCLLGKQYVSLAHFCCCHYSHNLCPLSFRNSCLVSNHPISFHPQFTGNTVTSEVKSERGTLQVLMVWPSRTDKQCLSSGPETQKVDQDVTVTFVTWGYLPMLAHLTLRLYCLVK